MRRDGNLEIRGSLLSSSALARWEVRHVAVMERMVRSLMVLVWLV